MPYKLFGGLANTAFHNGEFVLQGQKFYVFITCPFEMLEVTDILIKAVILNGKCTSLVDTSPMENEQSSIGIAILVTI